MRNHDDRLEAAPADIERGFDAVYVSEDSLEDGDNPRFWFQVDADRNPPSSFPIAGNGLVLGTDPEGARCDVKNEVRSRITFTRRKFRGFDERIEDGSISVTVKAPILVRSTWRDKLE